MKAICCCFRSYGGFMNTVTDENLSLRWALLIFWDLSNEVIGAERLADSRVRYETKQGTNLVPCSLIYIG